jgi:hypothetical protein
MPMTRRARVAVGMGDGWMEPLIRSELMRTRPSTLS